MTAQSRTPGDLDGRVALVTGSAQGMGLAIAGALRAAGAAVALSDVNEDALREAEETLGGAGDGLKSFAADLGDPAAAAGLPDRVHGSFGRLDIVVNNAGIRSVHAFLEHPLDAWQRTQDVNLTAPFLICQAAARHMVTQGEGRIVNVTSSAARLGFKNRSAYNASKAGLEMLTKSIALELGAHGVRCNAVAPGVIETPINSAYLKGSELTPIILDGTPVGHWGQPADIAAAVLFLCSPGSDFVNGAVLAVDGGWTAGKGY